MKKLGRIADGAAGGLGAGTGPDADSRSATTTCAIDVHSRLAYSEVLPDETAHLRGFMLRAAGRFLKQGIDTIDEVMTDNALAYTNSRAFAKVLEVIGATHITNRSHCPRQYGKVERFNRTLQSEWAYR